MDSTKEFERVERELENDMNDLMDHQSKKHKSFDESLELGSSMDDSMDINNLIIENCSDSEKENDQQIKNESLKDIITKVMQQHNMNLNEYDQVFNKLRQKLQQDKIDKESLRECKRSLMDQLNMIKDSMKEMTVLVNNNRKRSVNDLTYSPDDHNHHQVQDDIEVARRVFPSIQICHNNENNDSYFFDNNQLPKNCTLLPDTPQQQSNNDNDGLNVFDSNEKKLLLDQIKDLQEKYHSERQFYLEENERLHSTNDQYADIIQQLKKSIQSSGGVSGNSSLTNFTADHLIDNSSNSKGLFDWPIDDTINGEIGTNECNNCTPTNNRMLHVLSDLVKTFLDIENDIEKHLDTLSLNSTANSTVDLKKTFDDSFFYQGLPSIEGAENFSDLAGDGLLEDNLTSGNSGLYYSTSNSLNQSTHIQDKTNDLEDDVVLVASKRLRSAVERVLKILSDVVVNQNNQSTDLQAALQNESVCRDKLARQLIDKETLIAHLENDKKTILEQTSDYFAIKSERDHFKSKADEYEKDRDKFIEQVKKFQDEKQHFVKGLPQLQNNDKYTELSKENEILNNNLSQLQNERENLLQKINVLNQEIENLKHEKDNILEKKNAEFDDILCQIESNEKTFHSMKKFIEEQTSDRENEREEYNQEITNLKNQIKQFEQNDTKLALNVKNLEDQIALFQEEKNDKDEKIDELEKQAQLSTVEISELNMNVKNLEKELLDSQKVKDLLHHRLKDVCQNLNVKTTERLNWEELLQVINNLVDLEKANLKLKNIQDKHSKFGDIPDKQKSSQISPQEDNSVFLTINMLNNKLKSLNEQVDVLIDKNNTLTNQLDDANETIEQLQQIRNEKEALEKIIFEFKKENQFLQDEINDNHLKYSELKVKVENSIDVQHFKRVVDELENKLDSERLVNESLKIKLEQTNRDYNDLEEKLNAHEKEIKSYKDLVKNYENQQKNILKDKNDIRDKFDSLNVQFNDTNLKMLSKNKTIAVLEQNVELLKNNQRTLRCEKDVYLEKLKSMDENHNQVIVYEKNMDKLRLQLKITQDRVNFLDLEVKSLKKKAQILERENEILKVENFKIQRSKTDSSLAAKNKEHMPFIDGDLQDNSSGGGGTQNILMLKVRRLLGQKNALIYQKNYLLHLLDSCHSGELDTLEALDRLNHYKDFDNVDNLIHSSRGKAKFRAAVYTIIALRRMKWMVKLWQYRKQEYLVYRPASSLSQKIPIGMLQNGHSSRMTSNTSLGSNSSSSSSPSSTLNRMNFGKNAATVSDLNATMKGFVDRLHNVHDTLGLQTKKS